MFWMLGKGKFEFVLCAKWGEVKLIWAKFIAWEFLKMLVKAGESYQNAITSGL